jgi:hypothetical protein
MNTSDSTNQVVAMPLWIRAITALFLAIPIAGFWAAATTYGLWAGLLFAIAATAVVVGAARCIEEIRHPGDQEVSRR